MYTGERNVLDELSTCYPTQRLSCLSIECVTPHIDWELPLWLAWIKGLQSDLSIQATPQLTAQSRMSTQNEVNNSR